MKIPSPLILLILILVPTLTQCEALKVRLEGDRIVVYSQHYCGSQKINPKNDFVFQVQFKGSMSKEINFNSTKDEHIHDLEFDSDFPEAYSNFSLKVFKDEKNEFRVVIYQDGGNEDSRIDCPSNERSEFVHTIKAQDSLVLI